MKGRKFRITSWHFLFQFRILQHGNVVGQLTEGLLAFEAKKQTRFLSWGLSAQGGWGLRRETGDEASFPTRWPGQGRWVLVEAVKSCMILFYFIFFLIGSFACSPGNTYGLCFLSNKIPNHGATGLASGWQCSQIETSWGECLVSHIIFTKQNRQVLIVAWESPVTLNPPELRRIHFIELYNDSPTGAAG